MPRLCGRDDGGGDARTFAGARCRNPSRHRRLAGHVAVAAAGVRAPWAPSWSDGDVDPEHRCIYDRDPSHPDSDPCDDVVVGGPSRRSTNPCLRGGPTRTGLMEG